MTRPYISIAEKESPVATCPYGAIKVLVGQGHIINIPEGVKSILLGMLGGATLLAAIGFSVGGWVTDATSNRRVDIAVNTATQTILVDICIGQSQEDPNLPVVLSSLKATHAYARHSVVEDAGWATMPGKSSAGLGVAKKCAARIVSTF